MEYEESSLFPIGEMKSVFKYIGTVMMWAILIFLFGPLCFLFVREFGPLYFFLVKDVVLGLLSFALEFWHYLFQFLLWNT